ncbi:hypothetical protein [Gordonia sp. FQ]|uniref:hypothetical protein n=1 Tax=Gordonia sp. FQ TaxID=3446634 RepID=UPI003F85F138
MAKTAQHEPGDSSIHEVEPKRQADGSYVMRWRWWPYDGSAAKDYRSRGRTKGEARAAALEKLDELKEGAGGDGRWTKASTVSAYIKDVVKPAIESSTKLSDDSKALYKRSLVLIEEQSPRTLADLAQFRQAEKVVTAIAAKNGRASGKTARNVLNRWIFGQMRRDGIIVQSPLAGMDVDLGNVKTTKKSANDTALTEVDYNRLLDHLLMIDVDTVELPKRSREAARDKIRGAVEITLLQMTTGMRLGSARQVEPHEVIDNASGGVNVFIPANKIKGRKAAKMFTVLDDRVAERVKARRDATPAGAYLYGAPADRTKVWDRRNCTREIEKLYVSLADELGIEELREDIRSHGWRTTLNIILYALPAHVRAEWFGHSEAVNAAHYVDPTADLSPMVAAAKERRLRVVGE